MTTITFYVNGTVPITLLSQLESSLTSFIALDDGAPYPLPPGSRVLALQFSQLPLSNYILASKMVVFPIDTLILRCGRLQVDFRVTLIVPHK